MALYMPLQFSIEKEASSCTLLENVSQFKKSRNLTNTPIAAIVTPGRVNGILLKIRFDSCA